MTDRIVVSGIEVFARHGVLEGEQEAGQIFTIDVELRLDLGPAGASDDLADTIDYGALASRVHELAGTERWNLVERVAQRVAESVLADPKVMETVVTVHKPQAPIEVPFRDVSVTIRRSR